MVKIVKPSSGFLAGVWCRWPELRAAAAWIVESWVRPADLDAGWEQGPDHSRQGGDPENAASR